MVYSGLDQLPLNSRVLRIVLTVVYINQTDTNKTWLLQGVETMCLKNSTLKLSFNERSLRPCNSMMRQLNKTDNEPNSHGLLLHVMSVVEAHWMHLIFFSPVLSAEGGHHLTTLGLDS